MQRLKLALLGALLSVLASCTMLAVRHDFESLPLLPPVAFGSEASALQSLTVSRESGGAALQLDAALEIDSRTVRVAGLLLGQRVLLLNWDGSQLQETRETTVPGSLSGHSILRDLQLVYWPGAAIRAVLPPGWILEEVAGVRRLYRRAKLVFESERHDALPLGSAALWNHLGRYRIDIKASHEPG
jgi:Protein of unknown function (DUF3261)